MANLNIDPTSLDMYNRYTFPSPILNYTKNSTVFSNCSTICMSLRRDISTLSKYLSLELGVSSRVENKEVILKGKIQEDDILKKIYKFIENYVLCKECRNPETVAQENEIKCLACGYKIVPPKKDKIYAMILKMKNVAEEYKK